MSLSITVPREYGYVILTATASFILSTWLGIRTGPFRKAAKVPYPTHMVSREEVENADSPEQKQALHLFNCAQRGHYQFMEHYNTVLPALLIAGVRYPIGASLAGLGWVVFRVFYAVGYTNPAKANGTGRYAGSGFYFCQLALYIMTGLTGWSLLQ
ncbi:glutation S-transferase [Xylariales sp. PMI_506]|nr:glutation S-transferase [Xylariales sp. PMI_506]